MLIPAFEAIQAKGGQLIVMGTAIETSASSFHNSNKKIIDFLKLQANILVIDTISAQEKWGTIIRHAADFTIVPSHAEACGLVPMEAMSSASIPISSDVQGLKDTVIPLYNNKGTGFMYSNAGGHKKQIINLHQAIAQACDFYQTLSHTPLALNKFLLSLVKKALAFDWAGPPSAQYLHLYKAVTNENNVFINPAALIHQTAAFIATHQFKPDHLNDNNHNGVTPLTLAAEQKKFSLAISLVKKGANPIIENCHGNNVFVFIKNNSTMLRWMQRYVLHKKTCIALQAQKNALLQYGDENFIIIKKVQGGMGCLMAFIIRHYKSKALYFAKIAQAFHGYEIRNHQSFNLLYDVIIVNNIKENNKSFLSAQCMIQKFIPGLPLPQALKTVNFIQKLKIIYSALHALHYMHSKTFVHLDALPANCHWNPLTKKSIFIDLESSRKLNELSHFSQNQLIQYDYTTFLEGKGYDPSSRSQGVLDYFPSALRKIAKVLCLHYIEHHISPAIFTPHMTSLPLPSIRILHASLEFAEATLGGLGVMVTQMINACHYYETGKNIIPSIITPFYTFLKQIIAATHLCFIQHLYNGHWIRSQILYYRHHTQQCMHYLIQPEAPYHTIFTVQNPQEIYASSTSSLLAKILYYNSAVAAFVASPINIEHPNYHILQLHDWHTGLIAELIKKIYHKNVFTPKIVFTAHVNNVDHGTFPAQSLHGIGLNFTEKNIIVKKEALEFTDFVVGVSPTLMEDCKTVKSSSYIEKKLALSFKTLEISKRSFSILNGFTYKQSIPASLMDPNGSISSSRFAIKKTLFARVNTIAHFWKVDVNLPVVLYVGRFSKEKGIDMLAEALAACQNKANFIIMGIGMCPEIIEIIKSMEKTDKFLWVIFTATEQEQYGAQVRAIADFIFIPSHREACGLIGMEGLAQGSIPITTSAGGLKNFLKPLVYDQRQENANGQAFIYEDYNTIDLHQKMQTALSFWYDSSPSNKDTIAKRLIAESKQYGWLAPKGALTQYEALYKNMMQTPARIPGTLFRQVVPQL